MSTRLEYALSYAQAGFFLHPCKEDKRPHLTGWNEKASNDPQQIQAWGQQFPNCRWGVECGKSGLFILDSDNKEGKNGENTLALLQADADRLPETFTVRTKSGGLHRWFRGVGKTTAGVIGEAVDTRSVGGYAIIPDGADYLPLNNAPVAEAPQWLLQKAGRASDKERPKDANEPAPGVTVDNEPRVLDAVEYAMTRAPGAEAGNRDKTAYAVALALRDFGLSPDTTLRILRDVWAARQDVEIIDYANLYDKVRSAYEHGKNKLGENLPEAIFSPVPTPHAEGLQAFDAGELDARLIPKRDWLLGISMIKKFLTVTVAPGGTGKSNLSIIEALAITTGRCLTGEHVHEKGNVWLHNGEDPLDEIARRITAACSVHKVKPHELKGRFFYTSGRITPITLVREVGRGQLFVDENAIKAISKFITDNRIKLWIIDPFVDMHDCPENDNGAINRVAKILSAIADASGCAIHAVHHTRKKGKDGGLTDMDSARGASALLAAARIGRNLNGMSDKDHQELSPPLSAGFYVRLDNSKSNMALPSESAQWFEKVDVELPNGDHVGTLKTAEIGGKTKIRQADMIRQAAVAFVDDNGGRASLNAISVSLEKDKDIGISRSWGLRKLGAYFEHEYVTKEGAVYVLEEDKLKGKMTRFLTRRTE